jgi:hypothetical protein
LRRKSKENEADRMNSPPSRLMRKSVSFDNSHRGTVPTPALIPRDDTDGEHSLSRPRSLAHLDVVCTRCWMMHRGALITSAFALLCSQLYPHAGGVASSTPRGYPKGYFSHVERNHRAKDYTLLPLARMGDIASSAQRAGTRVKK